MAETPVGNWGNELLESILSDINGVSGAAQKLDSVDNEGVAEVGGLLINISANEGYDRSAVDDAALKVRQRLKELGVESETADDPNLNTREWKKDSFGNQFGPYLEIYTEEITSEAMRKSNV